MLELHLNNKYLFSIDKSYSETQICDAIQENLGINEGDFYLIHNGKRLQGTKNLHNSIIHVVLKLNGGKGGFGSMLRAIGAQIEKTTNREACRDLSGRRLRDINEEKRLKNWIDQQADREKEAADKKQKKIERLCQRPKHEFKDDNYDKERSDLPERLEDAIEQGLNAAAVAGSSGKRKSDVGDPKKKKKKSKLWLDEDFDSDISSSDEEKSISEEDSNTTQTTKPDISSNLTKDSGVSKDEINKEQDSKDIIIEELEKKSEQN